MFNFFRSKNKITPIPSNSPDVGRDAVLPARQVEDEKAITTRLYFDYCLLYDKPVGEKSKEEFREHLSQLLHAVTTQAQRNKLRRL